MQERLAQRMSGRMSAVQPGNAQQGRSPLVGTAQRSADAGASTGGPRLAAPTWDQRLYSGLQVAAVPTQTRAALTEALGMVGVEAEFFLLLVAHDPDTTAHTRASGELLLQRLEAAAQRIRVAAATLEVAVQGYLAALEAGVPGLHMDGDDGDVWWPAVPTFTLPGEPLDLRLRRCGFAYRHVVMTHLATIVEAIAEQLTQVLHALNTLPPAGIVPTRTLYSGLAELTAMLQGYVVPHHIVDLNERTPGLLTSIARMRQLDADEDTSLASDIAWAHAQYAQAYAVLQQHGGGYDGRQRSPASPASGTAAQQQWALAATRDWHETVMLLERLRQSDASALR